MASLAQPTRALASQGDSAHKRLFSHPRMVVDLLRLLGEPWVDALDLRRLDRLPVEHVADDGRTRRQDMPWRVPFRPAAGLGARAAVLVHLEFQSRTDPYMAERMLEYAALLRRDLLRADGAGLMAGGLVPAHLPLLVYNGRAPWNAPLRVETRTAWAPSTLEALQPRFALRLVDAGTGRDGRRRAAGGAGKGRLDSGGDRRDGAFALVRSMVRRCAAASLRRRHAALGEPDGDTDDA